MTEYSLDVPVDLEVVWGQLTLSLKHTPESLDHQSPLQAENRLGRGRYVLVASASLMRRSTYSLTSTASSFPCFSDVSSTLYFSAGMAPPFPRVAPSHRI